MEFIEKRVHELYWKDDMNCARTMLVCLSELFNIKLERQTILSAAGLHGAGGFRAQCGLVEGGLMFIGIYQNFQGKAEEDIVKTCYEYAESFQQKFGSLRCYDLRPAGFTPDDQPHMCEVLTCKAIEYAFRFLKARR